MDKLIPIEIVYALENEQKIYKLELRTGSTVEDALQESTILKDYPELKLNNLNLGIYSKKANLDTILKAYDRIEIYRPLLIDPKQARLLRAKKPKV